MPHVDIDKIIAQENALRFAHFDEDDAWELGSIMRSRAVLEGLPVVIHIQVSNRQLFYTALSGTCDDNRIWVARKIAGVLRYGKSSYRLGLELKRDGVALGPDRGVAPGEIAAHGGCFPVHIIGTGIVGTITVSGLPQREDHNFVVACLCAYLGIDEQTLALKE